MPSALPFGSAQRGPVAFDPLAKKSKIKHIVIIVQENRSFNNLFYGYPGATTQSYGLDSENKKIELKPISLKTTWDMQHNGQGFITSCNGTGTKVQGTDCRMNGFDKESCSPKVYGTHCPDSKYLAYSYVPHSETKPYFDMAHQYVLGDEMYASDFDISSFISHQYIIAGVNPESAVDYPSADWGCPGGPVKLDSIPVLLKGRIWLNKQRQSIKVVRPCWNLNTLADELDAAKLSWAFYAVPVGAGISTKYTCGNGGNSGPDGKSSRGSGIWSAYQAIEHICYGPDWATDVAPFAPPSKFLTDIQQGELRAVTWITPTDANSDHGGSDSDAGPSWVASLVNAIGESKFWDSTAIFIFWDDPGGWYDPEPPQYLKDSDYDSLGYRLPLLIISPYAKQGYVDHTHYEHGTILKFVENQFGLPPLEDPSDKGASDIRANPPSSAFNFKQAPRKFVPIKAPLDANYFIHEPLDTRPPDTD
ncbi:MAG TPA: alkaline phosphatase family protein [Candidatus Cybelea sp.]|nr:alkaline phosphatase family protein [Candidatus Cybelea sp.]